MGFESPSIIIPCISNLTYWWFVDDIALASLVTINRDQNNHLYAIATSTPRRFRDSMSLRIVKCRTLIGQCYVPKVCLICSYITIITHQPYNQSLSNQHADVKCSGAPSLFRLFPYVIGAGIFLMETSDYFSEILWSSYTPCSQSWHRCVTYVDWFVH